VSPSVVIASHSPSAAKGRRSNLPSPRLPRRLRLLAKTGWERLRAIKGVDKTWSGGFLAGRGKDVLFALWQGACRGLGILSQLRCQSGGECECLAEIEAGRHIALRPSSVVVRKRRPPILSGQDWNRHSDALDPWRPGDLDHYRFRLRGLREHEGQRWQANQELVRR
jgi:hypothetical protein